MSIETLIDVIFEIDGRGVKIPTHIFPRERRGGHTYKNKKSNGVLPQQGIEVKENGQRRDYARWRKTRLGELVTLFTNIDVGTTAAQEKDVLGRVYEYFLGKFASAEGKLGGEFYTPSCVVRTLVEMIEPFDGQIYENCTTSLIRVAAA